MELVGGFWGYWRLGILEVLGMEIKLLYAYHPIPQPAPLLFVVRFRLRTTFPMGSVPSSRVLC